MIDTPQIARSAGQQFAMIRLTVPTSQIRTVMGPGIREVYETLAAQGISPAGPWFTHHVRRPTEVFDCEICVPVTTPVAPAGRVQPGVLPAATVARTVYYGPYEGLAAAWSEFMAWIEAEGHVPREDLWEIYAVGPESGRDASTWRTELNRPLVEVARSR
jgi:effector-binding domain-containing protein